MSYKIVLVKSAGEKITTRTTFAAAKSEAFDRAKKLAGEDAVFFSSGPRDDREIGYRGEAGTAYIYHVREQRPDEGWTETEWRNAQSRR